MIELARLHFSVSPPPHCLPNTLAIHTQPDRIELSRLSFFLLTPPKQFPCDAIGEKRVEVLRGKVKHTGEIHLSVRAEEAHDTAAAATNEEAVDGGGEAGGGAGATGGADPGGGEDDDQYYGGLMKNVFCRRYGWRQRLASKLGVRLSFKDISHTLRQTPHLIRVIVMVFFWQVFIEIFVFGGKRGIGGEKVRVLTTIPDRCADRSFQSAGKVFCSFELRVAAASVDSPQISKKYVLLV